jgi:hypothetical protein
MKKPKTSIEAYATVAEMKEAHYAIIKAAIIKLGKSGGHYEQIASFCGLGKDQVNRRLSEMVRDGVIFNTGETRKTLSGRNAMVRSIVKHKKNR